MRAQLYAALDIGYLSIETFKYLNGLASDCFRLISSFIEKVKTGAKSGSQYKHIVKKDTWLEDRMAEHRLMLAENGKVVPVPK